MLDVAEQVFSARGFQAATMDEIAERVGVTKPLIYDYFGSKEGLLAATIGRARRELLSSLIDVWEALPDEAARDRLHAVVLAFFRYLDSHDDTYALVRSEGGLIGEAAVSIERVRQQTAKALAEAITSLPQFQHAPAAQLLMMAEIIIGGIERLAVVRHVTPGITAEAATELVVATAWDGLASLAQP